MERHREFHRVLAVDDNRDSLDVMELCLDNAGYQVSTYDSADAALRSLSKQDFRDFNFVLTDYEMPGTKGDEFSRHLHEINPAATIFLITGSIDYVSVETQHFIKLRRKPFSITSLISEMNYYATCAIAMSAINDAA